MRLSRPSVHLVSAGRSSIQAMEREHGLCRSCDDHDVLECGSAFAPVNKLLPKKRLLYCSCKRHSWVVTPTPHRSPAVLCVSANTESLQYAIHLSLICVEPGRWRSCGQWKFLAVDLSLIQTWMLRRRNVKQPSAA